MRFAQPSIEDGVEYLSGSLAQLLQERRELVKMEAGQRALKRNRYFPRNNFPKPHGGILDYHAQRWQRVREKYGNDRGQGLEAFGALFADTHFPDRHLLAGRLLPIR